MAGFQYKDASALLAAFFDKDRFSGASRYAELFSSWSALVGERYAAHSRPDDVVNGIFYVEVEHPGWLQLLQFKQAAILDGVRRLYPELGLRSIVFRIAKNEGGRNRDVGSSGGGAEPAPDADSVPDEGDSLPDEAQSPRSAPEAARKVAPEVSRMFADLKKMIDEAPRKNPKS